MLVNRHLHAFGKDAVNLEVQQLFNPKRDFYNRLWSEKKNLLQNLMPLDLLKAAEIHQIFVENPFNPLLTVMLAAPK